MSENIRAISLDRPAPYDAWLILNETAAIAFVPPISSITDIARVA